MRHYGQARRKFGRERGHRRSLIKNLATSLVEHQSLVTTTPKAKEAASYLEKLITKAKKGDLHSRRQVISGLRPEAAAKLVNEIVPKLGARNSGHLRVKSEGFRRGDHAAMSKIAFVDDLSLKAPVKPKAEPKPAPPKAKAKPAAARVKKTVSKKE